MVQKLNGENLSSKIELGLIFPQTAARFCVSMFKFISLYCFRVATFAQATPHCADTFFWGKRHDGESVKCLAGKVNKFRHDILRRYFPKGERVEANRKLVFRLQALSTQ